MADNWLDKFDPEQEQEDTSPKPDLPDPRRRRTRRKQRDPMETFGKVVAWSVSIGVLALVLAGMVRLFIWIVSGA